MMRQDSSDSRLVLTRWRWLSRHLIHQFLDRRSYCIGPDLIALRRGVKAVGHDLCRNETIDKKFVADVHVEHLLVVGELRQADVDGLDRRIQDRCLLGSTRIVARENTEQD